MPNLDEKSPNIPIKHKGSNNRNFRYSKDTSEKQTAEGIRNVLFIAVKFLCLQLCKGKHKAECNYLAC